MKAWHASLRPEKKVKRSELLSKAIRRKNPPRRGRLTFRENDLTEDEL
jgi:hypothetical protein